MTIKRKKINSVAHQKMVKVLDLYLIHVNSLNSSHVGLIPVFSQDILCLSISYTDFYQAPQRSALFIMAGKPPVKLLRAV